MRKITVFTNISLNGYFEGPDHDLSAFNHDFEAFPTDRGQQAGAFLFGHRTYEGMTFWETPQAAQMMPEVARLMNESQKYVASHYPFDPGWKNVTVLSGDVPSQVRELKQQPGSDIMIFGSNELVVSLMAEGLVDEFQLLINPVALEEGTALFKGLPGRVNFSLKSSQVFKSGTVMLMFEPVKQP